MPIVEITQADYDRLKQIETPGSGSPAATISRLLDLHDEQQSQKFADSHRNPNPDFRPSPNPAHSDPERSQAPRPTPPLRLPAATNNGEPLQFTQDNIPHMTHAKIERAVFNGVVPPRLKWRDFAKVALSRLVESVGSIQNVAQISDTRLVKGEKIDDGYVFWPELGFSCQSMSSIDAVKAIDRSARYLGVNAELDFRWLDKPDARYPGRRATLTLNYGSGADANSTTNPRDGEPLRFTQDNIPSMIHAKIERAIFDGVISSQLKWQDLAKVALLKLIDSVGSIQNAAMISGIRLVKGTKTDDGFMFWPELGYSFQRMSSIDTINAVNRSAKHLGVNVSLDIRWSDKPTARYPGQHAKLTLNYGGRR